MASIDDLPTLPMRDPGYWRDPYPILREIRAKHRVARTPEGMIAVLRWDDGVDAVKGTQFIRYGVEALERVGFKPGDPMHTWRKNALNVMDGPHHLRVRALVASALSKRRMDELRPLIRRHAHALLDEKIEAKELEARTDYAIPLPRRVMLDYLGLHDDEIGPTDPNSSEIIDAFGSNSTPELRTRANEAVQKSMDHVAELLERRRMEPKDDLLTHLVQARDEHGQLSEGELITNFSLLWGSGTTTSGIIASGLMELARRPAQAELLRRDAERWKRGASEESLRYRPAINSIALKAAEATRAFDLDLMAGKSISVILGSVNRDPRHWEDPEEFDIRRDGRKTSLSFGIGRHVCLGHSMARATIEEALAVFVQRCDGLELLEEPRWVPFVMENKLESLRLGLRVGESDRPRT